MSGSNPKLESLSKILLRERDGGFQDSTVIGGLDRFLERWSTELEPELGELGSYSARNPSERQAWADATLSRLCLPTDSPGPVVLRKAPARRSAAKVKKAEVGLSDSAISLKWVSTQNLSKLERLGVETVEDLLYLFPNRHNDFAGIRKVADLEPGTEQTVNVSVWEAVETRQGSKRRSTQAVLGDDTGNVRAIWFGNPYLVRTFRPGTEVVLSGKVNVFRGSLVFESPEYELLQGQEELVHAGRLVPVYPTVNGLYQRTLRRIVRQALEVGTPQVVDFLPEDTRSRMGFVGLRDAIRQAHYPDDATAQSAARHRLAFDELLTMQLAALKRKLSWQQEDEGVSLSIEPGLLEGFLDSLPFELTRAQDRVLGDVLGDLAASKPMSRLLQGDVGSGKTVVAAAALLVAALNDYQGAFMAPTELLAEQHFFTLSSLLQVDAAPAHDEHLVSVRIEGVPRPLTMGLLLGSLPRSAKVEMHRMLAEGEVDLVIGTHALLQEGVEIPELALAVVDEQHRFGVMQRAKIRSKGRRPHLLAMSATPIPRSLALTLYGDLDISVIDELPPGRLRIRTRWVEPAKRETAYGFIRKQVEQERQAFIVCPLIEESEVIQTRAAVEEYERLSVDVFPDLSVGLLHGRMALREKELAMQAFQRREVDVLVSTPVVEVGIDVPNATVMLVDGADRFGLSQLHQFRGRVGRGIHQSYCLLLADDPGQGARERLKIMERLYDGFELAEEDLRIRGPGDYLGTRQSGLPDLKMAKITDYDILSLAREEAARILESDPELVGPENALLAEHLRRYTSALAGELS